MSLDMSDTGGQCDAASRLFQTRVGRGRYVLARVCVCVACAYNLAGGSCTGDQGSSELVSPLKAFLPLRMEGPVDLLCREFRSRAKAR